MDWQQCGWDWQQFNNNMVVKCPTHDTPIQPSPPPAAMSPAVDDLRVFFFPFMSPGHMIPMLDIAAIFARRGAAATIITTPGNEPLVRPTILRSSTCPHPIQLLLISFPSTFSTLSSENLASVPLAEYEALYNASFALRQPFIDLLGSVPPPDCLISDAIFLWTADIVAKLHIPRIIFEGPGAFALCVIESLELAAAACDKKLINLDGLPHRIELTGSQVPEAFNSPQIIKLRREVEAKTYGVVVNSFYELEPEYVEHYRKPGRRVWLVGPVFLNADPTDRGRAPTIGDEWLSWLYGRAVGSVVYVCFGSLTELSKNQLQEIKAGLEDSGHPFIWAAKGGAAAIGSSNKGLIINGWVPQVLILNHPAVGGFLTHCGWNSTLEAVAAGVPMATLPLFYDQYINEKLVTEVLEIGVKVREKGGGANWVVDAEEEMRRDEVAAAVGRVMGEGEEAERMRVKVRELGEKAKAAVEVGGSSEMEMGRLMEELAGLKAESGRG